MSRPETTTAGHWARPAAAPSVPGYTIDELLGEGLHGVVWSATEDSTGQRQALKVLHGVGGEVVDEGASVRRIERVAAVACRHLVGVHGVLELADGRRVVVLDLADGGSLRDVVAVRGPLPLGEVVTALTPVASALDALHRAGLVHADVAPGNVLFTSEGMPMLGDLEAVHAVDEFDPPVVDGTPGFTAPEVMAGARMTEAADVWALGALAWYVLTGGSVPGAAPSAEEVEGAVGAGLARVVTAMLDPDPEARPSAADAAAAVYAAAPPRAVTLVGRQVDPATALTRRIRREAGPVVHTRAEARAMARGSAVVAPWWRTVPRWAGWGAAAVLALAVVLGGAVWLWPWAGARWAAVAASGPAGSGTASSAATASAGSSTAPSPSSGAGGSAGPAVSGPPASSRGSPTTTPAPIDGLRANPGPTLQGLLDARASAFTSGQADALAAAVAPGTVAYQGDSQLLGDLAARGQGYEGLGYRVRSARVVSADPANAVVEAVVDRTSYTVVGPGQDREVRPAQTGVPFRYVVAWTDGGWRLGAGSAM